MGSYHKWNALEVENDELRRENARLQSTVDNLRAEIVAERDLASKVTEITKPRRRNRG